MIDFAYSSVVTIKQIKKGEKFTLENTWVKRPGTGEILASDLDRVLGKVCKEDLSANVQINFDNIE